jgi:hypothetical protein
VCALHTLRFAVLREENSSGSIFNSSSCSHTFTPQVITKLLYLLNQGETFTKVHARACSIKRGRVFMLLKGCVFFLHRNTP